MTTAAVALALLGACLLPHSASGKVVRVSLSAGWGETKLEHEAAEFLADHCGRDVYWRYVRELATSDGGSGGARATAEDSYHAADEAATALALPDETRRALSLALATRYYSPRAAAVQSLCAAPPSQPAEDLYVLTPAGDFLASAAEVAAHFEGSGGGAAAAAADQCVDEACKRGAAAAPPVQRALDRRWGEGGYTLCASLDAPGLDGVLALLQDEKRNSAGFVLRYFDRNQQQQTAEGRPKAPLQLEGYGVSMMIKDMEYKAMDDKEKSAGDADAAQKEDDDAASDDEQLAVLLGVRIEEVKRSFPNEQESVLDLEAKLRELESERSSTADIKLDVWEVQNIGWQTVYKILKNKKAPLRELASVTQDFPRHVSALSKIQNKGLKRISRALAKEAQTNPIYPSGDGESVLYINGRHVAIAELSTARLFEVIAREDRTLSAIRGVLSYTSADTADDFLLTKDGTNLAFALKKVGDAQGSAGGASGAIRYRFPLSSTHFMNDIAKDEMYSSWPRSLSVMVQPPTMYGAPSSPRRNLYTAISLIDPLYKGDLTIAHYATMLLRQMAPIRMGITLVRPTESTEEETVLREKIACVFYNLMALSPTQAFSFLARLRAGDGMGGEPGEDSQVAEAEIYEMFGGKAKVDELIAAGDMDADACRARLDTDTAIARQKSLYTKGGAHLFNGRYSENPQTMIESFYEEMAVVKGLVEGRVLTDKVKDEYTFLLDHFNAAAKHQPLVANAKVQARGLYSSAAESLALLDATPWARAEGAEDSAVAAETVLLFLDPSSPHAAAHVANLCSRFSAADAGADLKASRFSVVLKTTEGAADTGLLLALASLQGAKKPKESARAVVCAAASAAAAGKLPEVDASVVAAERLRHERLTALLSEECPAGATCVVANSLVVVLGDAATEAATEAPLFEASDYALLSDKVRATAGAVARAFDDVAWSEVLAPKAGDDAVTTASDVASAAWLSNKVALLAGVLAEHLKVSGGAPAIDSEAAHISNTTCTKPCRVGFRSRHVREGEELGKLDVVAVLNPLSTDAQKVASFLNAFATQRGAGVPGAADDRDRINLDVSVYLNPPATLTEVPLKTFYRYVMSSVPKFDEEGGVKAPSGSFAGLPEKQVLTMGLHEPEAWIVTTKQALHDIDNIKLADVSGGVLQADFQLEHIIVSGSCNDESAGQPPRGMPLRLSGAGLSTDTSVMTNLGYYQLKANPGVFSLSIPDLDKALEVFDASTVAQELVVDSFHGLRIDLAVRRNPGKEGIPFLEDDADQAAEAGGAGKKKKEKKDSGIVSALSSMIYGGDDATKGGDAAEKAAVVPRAQKPTLNIFSVATGHLYERFLKIMIHTTMLNIDKNDPTKNRVKFWFLNNFLSPQFKANIHKMAEKWGFEVELVTYKWPKWLRRQTQKQRIIWGYKVLFLDVLFPLDVEKVIFVDADQIIRADLHELYNLDMEGKAVGYTPFCLENKNDDTFGFRFWEQGYWKDHLQGRPYHISAIYVVDLNRFRARGVGDQYRAIYDQLSKDPNSLSNLDQDLPNYSQNQVPIFSLPEHWLWCETWCNQESKAEAKTIDLCNNPLTKTPKLVNAKRIVPEWSSYDKVIDDWEKSLG